eukprot:gene25656-32135_t
MPAEPVNWIKRMLTYTVAGGKMNRGLSLMAVQQTLAASNGRALSNKAYYPELVDLFIEVTRQTELGQLMDLTSQPLGGPIDLSRFTLDRYTSIVKYKTAFYSFYLPVALGMIVSGITDPNLYQKAREILLIMGEYFQIQDDYLDCYGAPEEYEEESYKAIQKLLSETAGMPTEVFEFLLRKIYKRAK